MNEKLYQCPECGLHYEDEVTAKHGAQNTKVATWKSPRTPQRAKT